MSQIAVLSMVGLVSFTLFYETMPLAITAVIALLFGQKLQDRIAINVYRRILHGLLVVLSVILVIQFLY